MQVISPAMCRRGNHAPSLRLTAADMSNQIRPDIIPHVTRDPEEYKEWHLFPFVLIYVCITIELSRPSFVASNQVSYICQNSEGNKVTEETKIRVKYVLFILKIYNISSCFQVYHHIERFELTNTEFFVQLLEVALAVWIQSTDL